MTRFIAPALALCAAQALAATAPPRESELAALERHYLSCERTAAVQRLAPGDAAACSWAAEQVLQHRFGGDHERMLQWWRAERDRNDSARAPFEVARAHYEAGRYAQAYSLFAELADCGHREAARLALQMRRFGPELYGTAFDAAPSRLARWQGTLSADAPAGAGTCTAA